MTNLSFSEYNINNNRKSEKRQPTLGKPKISKEVKPSDLTQPQPQGLYSLKNIENMQNVQITDEKLNENEEQDVQNSKNRIYQKIGNFSDNDSTMGDFEPISPPEITDKSQLDSRVIPQPIKYSSIQSEDRHSDYNQIYERPLSFANERKPYYANMGISRNSSEMDRILEKLEYLTHLLEEQKNEKTDNILEETVLYTFLGVFVIYIVDSFSRSGKYIR